MSTPHSFNADLIKDFCSSPAVCVNGNFSQPMVDGFKGMKAHLAQINSTGTTPVQTAHL